MGVRDSLVRMLGGVPAAPRPPRREPNALTGWPGQAFDAADISGQRMQGWMPPLFSADTERSPYRNRIVSRVRDLVRNDGWAAGAVTRVLDNAVGVMLRPVSKPDYRYLAHLSGNGAFDALWAHEFARAIDSWYRAWAEDPGRYNDAERMLTFAQQLHLGFRHLIVDGDALAYLPWLEGNIGMGRARYATAVQIIDPDRLSNPQHQYDLDADFSHLRQFRVIL